MCMGVGAWHLPGVGQCVARLYGRIGSKEKQTWMWKRICLVPKCIHPLSCPLDMQIVRGPAFHTPATRHMMACSMWLGLRIRGWKSPNR